jgi:hypothetical protein
MSRSISHLDQLCIFCFFWGIIISKRKKIHVHVVVFPTVIH